MRIWRELLRRSSELLNRSGHAAIDATYFGRHQASNRYLKRCDRGVRAIQATVLVDNRPLRGLDVHCTGKWPDGTKTGSQVARHNAGDRLGLAADKRYDDMSPREELRVKGVRPLIKHRVSAPTRIDDEPYNQRSACETVNSVLKRLHGSAVRARAWYLQFREVTLAAAVCNVGRAVIRRSLIQIMTVDSRPRVLGEF